MSSTAANLITGPTLQFPEEERDMTFQVALIGSDGLIVGSDRRLTTYLQSGTDDYSASIPGQIFKFEKSEDENLVCAYAGSPFSQQFAQEIVNWSKGRVGCGGWKNEAQKISDQIPFSPPKDEIIVVEKSDDRQVHIVSRGARGLWPVLPCSTWITTGNNSIPARFLLQHFWERKPIAELKSLALLTLYCATQEDPTGVGVGFDLMTLKNHTIDWELYEAKDKQILEMWSAFESAAESAIYPPIRNSLSRN